MANFYDSIQDQHSRYWLGDIFKREMRIERGTLDDSDIDNVGDNVETALRLIRLKRSVANFVQIVTGEPIPVVFSSGNQSYTEGKQVVLSAGKGTDTNFDSLVGLALHEASHILLSDFEFLKYAMGYQTRTRAIPPSLVDIWKESTDRWEANGLRSWGDLYQGLIKVIFNVLEDRRIDHWIYRNAPGYRPYYEAMYKRYWQSKQVEYAMRDQRVLIPTVENYLFHFTNMTNRYFDTRALPDLDLIYGMVDLNKINRFDADDYASIHAEFISNGASIPPDRFPNIWKATYRIAEIILTNSIGWNLEISPPGGAGYPCNDGEPDDNESGNEDGDPMMRGHVPPEEDEGDDLLPNHDTAPPPDMTEADEESDEGESGSGAGEPDEDEDSESDGGASDESDEESEDEAEGAGPSGDESEDEAEGSESDADSESTGESDADGESDGTDSTNTDAEGSDEDRESSDESEPENDSPYEFEVERRVQKFAEEEEVTRGRTGKLNEKKLKQDIEKQKEFGDGEVKKSKIKSAVDGLVNAMDDSGAELDMINVKGEGGMCKAKVLFIPTLTREQLMKGGTPFNTNTAWNWKGVSRRRGSRYGYRDNLPNSNVRLAAPSEGNLRPYASSERAVEKGLRMGRRLASRLSIRNQDQLSKFNRRPEGKIDKRRIANIGAGENSIFYHLRRVEYEPVFLHMSIDASSSMSGQKWEQSLAVAAALAYASSEIENLDVEVSIRAGVGSYAAIQIIYDSTQDTPNKIRSLWPILTHTGFTPEGLCFEAIAKRITARAKKRDAYFVNISDGLPEFSATAGQGYFGAFARQHTRSQVRNLEREGIKILSYFVKDDGKSYYHRSDDQIEGYFKEMYGKHSVITDVTAVNSIARTMNKLLVA